MFKMFKIKRYTKNTFTCVVSVYLDKDYRYDSFDKIPEEDSSKISHHEFEDFVLADEYCKVLREMNQEFMGRFIFNVKYLPIEQSENFTNKIEFYQVNYN